MKWYLSSAVAIRFLPHFQVSPKIEFESLKKNYPIVASRCQCDDVNLVDFIENIRRWTKSIKNRITMFPKVCRQFWTISEFTSIWRNFFHFVKICSANKLNFEFFEFGFTKNILMEKKRILSSCRSPILKELHFKISTWLTCSLWFTDIRQCSRDTVGSWTRISHPSSLPNKHSELTRGKIDPSTPDRRITTMEP